MNSALNYVTSESATCFIHLIPPSTSNVASNGPPDGAVWYRVLQSIFSNSNNNSIHERTNYEHSDPNVFSLYSPICMYKLCCICTRTVHIQYTRDSIWIECIISYVQYVHFASLSCWLFPVLFETFTLSLCRTRALTLSRSFALQSCRLMLQYFHIFPFQLQRNPHRV